MGFVGFVAKKNHWWQSDVLPKAIEQVSEVISPTANVMAYGTSMGGAGALLSAQFLKVDTLLAAAPPIVVDQEHAPWEERFPRVSDLTRQIFPLLPNMSNMTRTYVLYDPHFKPGVRHLAFISNAGQDFHRWPLAHSKHTPLDVLKQVGSYRNFTSTFFIEQDFTRARSMIPRSARGMRGIADLARAQHRDPRKSRSRPSSWCNFPGGLRA